MKAELNNENKARFFALYWAQYVGIGEDTNGMTERIHVSQRFTLPLLDKTYLELKPLSSISDEDAIEAGKLRSPEVAAHVYVGRNWIEAISCNYRHAFTDLGSLIPIEVIDFLRSRGYALPWMGLSVEEMVEAGWIKLQEREKGG